MQRTPRPSTCGMYRGVRGRREAATVAKLNADRLEWTELRNGMENKIMASMASALGPDKIDEQFVNAALDSAVEATAAMWRMSRSPTGAPQERAALAATSRFRVGAGVGARAGLG